jgi:hypothetical protein
MDWKPKHNIIPPLKWPPSRFGRTMHCGWQWLFNSLLMISWAKSNTHVTSEPIISWISQDQNVDNEVYYVHDYLKLDEYEPSRPLRSSFSRRLVVPRVSGTFQGEASWVFNDLPEDIRNYNNFRRCCRNCFAHFRDLAINKISNIS